MKVLLAIVAVTVLAFVLIRVFANGATGDCDAIAEDMASYELGNYAEPDQRAPAVEKYRSMCKDVKVTKQQSACFLKATSKFAAAKCAPEMFPDMDIPDCDDEYDCAIKTLDKFADRVCACGKNRTCAEGVMSDMTQWSQQMAQQGSKMNNPSPEAAKRAAASAERMSKCYQTAVMQ